MSENQLTEHPPQQTDLPDWLEQAAGGPPREGAEPVQQRFSAFGVTAMLIIVGLLFVIGTHSTSATSPHRQKARRRSSA